MNTAKILFLAVLLFSINFAFNACSETQFSSVGSGSQKLSDDQIPVEEDSMDTPEEVDAIDEDYGVDDEECVDDNKGKHKDLDKRKVKVCHVPPGNPEAQHTITIGWSAVRAHVEENHNRPDAEHKDYFGDCDKDGDL